MRTYIYNKKGFTLVEAMVAIALVLVGVTSVFATAQMGLSSTSAVRNRVTAMFLAQEAQEAVKNLKDSNLHKIATGDYPNRSWLYGIIAGPTNCIKNEACGYDITESYGDRMLHLCESYKCELKSEGGLYRQALGSSGEVTGFQRRIIINELNTKEASVRVVITRPDDPKFAPFEVTNVIYAWF